MKKKIWFILFFHYAYSYIYNNTKMNGNISFSNHLKNETLKSSSNNAVIQLINKTANEDKFKHYSQNNEPVQVSGRNLKNNKSDEDIFLHIKLLDDPNQIKETNNLSIKSNYNKGESSSKKLNKRKDLNNLKKLFDKHITDQNGKEIIGIEALLNKIGPIQNNLSSILNQRLLRLAPSINEIKNSRGINTQSAQEFFDCIIPNAIQQIKYVSRQLTHIFANDKQQNFTSLIRNARNSFDEKIRTYINNALKREVKNEYDEQYLFLDIVTATKMMLHSVEKMLFEKMAYNNLTSNNTHKANVIIEKSIANHMRSEMDNLCKHVKICRQFPGFIERCVGIIDELMQLDSARLNIFVGITKTVARDRLLFFKSFMTVNLLNIVKTNILSTVSVISDFREFLRVLKAVIKHRYKLMRVYDEELIIRTKSIRLLFDIIDKAFDLQFDEFTAITFDTFIKSLNHWRMGKRRDVNIPLKLFFERVVEIFTQNWDINTRKEMSTLIELLMTGTTSNKEVQHSLFTKGPGTWDEFPFDLLFELEFPQKPLWQLNSL